MPTIPDKSIDLILCDLPYGTTACAWDAVIPFEPLWSNYKRLIKENGAIVLFGNQPFTTMLIASNIEWFKYEMIWKKNKPTGFFIGNIQPLRSHENILVFYQKQPTYNPQMIKRTPHEFKECARINDSAGRLGEQFGKGKINPIKRKPIEEQWYKLPDSIIDCKKVDKRDGSQHPTQKPQELMERIILTYTNVGETVLDNTMGSGTTGEACVKTKREFIGIEMNDKYFDEAEQRINNAKLQTSLF